VGARKVQLWAAAAGGMILALTGAMTRALADDFAVGASPARFELSAKPGAVVRGVLEIDNAAPSPAAYAMKTADWTLDQNAGAQFSEALAPGSCRPWVAIERHEVQVPGHGAYRFRFEVRPPTDAPQGECRFAILIEGREQRVKTKSGVVVPVSGRLGVIVYLEVGNAHPELAVVGGVIAKVNGESTPVLRVKNSGDAHGRLAGFLSGVDAKGARIELTPASLPILPGEVRLIPLVVDRPDKGPVHIAYPITIRGKLSWPGGSAEISQPFAPSWPPGAIASSK
jgi:hypothetical protein